MKYFFSLLILVCLSFSAVAIPASLQQKVLKVAVSEGSPFDSLKHVPTGIVIDLWKGIAKINRWKYQFINVGENVDKAVINLANGKYDVLIGPISTTEQREKLVDFSRPYFISEIGVILLSTHSSSWIVLAKFFETFFAKVSLVFILLCFIFANCFWFLEKRNSEDYPQTYFAGIFYVLWHLFYHLFKGGPLPVPKSIVAKGLVIIWVFMTLFFIVSLTATLTSGLTITLSRRGEIAHIKQLSGKKLAVIRGTTGVKKATEVSAKIVLVKDLNQGIRLLEKKQVFGVIEDRLIAECFLKNHDNNKLYVAKIKLGYNELAFAVSDKNPIREKIDLSLTHIQEKGQAKEICRKYIGSRAIYCDF